MNSEKINGLLGSLWEYSEYAELKLNGFKMSFQAHKWLEMTFIREPENINELLGPYTKNIKLLKTYVK